MQNLVIDIGNSFSKLAIINNRDIRSVMHTEHLSPQFLENFLDDNDIENSIVSSVSTDVSEYETILKNRTNYIRFTGTSSSQIKNQYKTPETLGLDRYAAVIGAQSMYPQQNCLVIDAGSCITYDFVDRDKNYYGGSITPGINMRFKAMNQFTGRLPLVNTDFKDDANFGTDTQSSILSGVQKGVFYEALGFIGYFHQQWADLKVILCGGDVNFFDTQLKNSIFAHAFKTEPNLVLIGLNEVIHYHND
jgi:type III pantothenate kinase